MGSVVLTRDCTTAEAPSPIFIVVIVDAVDSSNVVIPDTSELNWFIPVVDVIC